LSSTSQQTSKSISVDYGRGDIYGAVYKDNVEIAGLFAEDVMFAALHSMSGLPNDHFDGLIGMAFPSLASGNIPPFFDYLIQQELVSHASFSMYLQNVEEESAIILGGIDPNYGASEFHYVNLESTQYWGFNIDGVKVGDKMIPESKKILLLLLIVVLLSF